MFRDWEDAERLPAESSISKSTSCLKKKKKKRHALNNHILYPLCQVLYIDLLLVDMMQLLTIISYIIARLSEEISVLLHESF